MRLDLVSEQLCPVSRSLPYRAVPAAEQAGVEGLEGFRVRVYYTDDNLIMDKKMETTILSGV